MITPVWVVICVALMAGTYLVRALPFWFPRIDSLPAGFKRFLDGVPAAALGALILPDALTGAPPIIALTVVTVAFALALRGTGITVIVLAAIAIAWSGLTLIAF